MSLGSISSAGPVHCIREFYLYRETIETIIHNSWGSNNWYSEPFDAVNHEHHTRFQATMKIEEQLALILSNLEEQTQEISGNNKKILGVGDSGEDLKKGEFEQWHPQVEDRIISL